VTLTVTHTTTAPGAALIGAAEWNEDHTIVGTPSGILWSQRAMQPVDYRGPTGTRRIDAATIAAATARFKRNHEDEMLLDLIDWIEA
jgi:hypothetical protein